jgi:hypothetical protein
MFDPKSVCPVLKPFLMQSVSCKIQRTIGASAFVFIALCGVCRAQQQPPAQQTQAPAAQSPKPDDQRPPDEENPEEQRKDLPPIAPAMPGQFVLNPAAGGCVQPAPPVTWRDYQGPFAKTMAIFAQRLERRSVGPPSLHHYKPGTLLCTLEVKDKFWLFVRDSTDPVAFLNAGYNAVIGQWQDSQPSFGTGPRGFGDRFGTALAGQASAGFFKDFVYPTMFREDPRFYRLGTGSVHRRIFHAMDHVILAHTEYGYRMFNFSEWLGDLSVIVLSNTYLPDNKRGVEPVAISMASTLGNNMGYDVLREFWPEIAKKFHLPFREQNDPAVITPTAVPPAEN